MVQRIEEHKIDGRRCGRHVSTVDLRALDHLFEAKLPIDGRKKLVDQSWARQCPVFDQGSLGSCTGNGSLGIRGTLPFFNAPKDTTPNFNEVEAVSIYSEATHLDGGGADQYYPPNDDGATVLGAMKALKKLGFVKGYSWGFTGHHVLTCLSQYGPVAVGFNWYDSFDSPNSNGLVSISPNAGVRGGHCWEVNKIDVENKRVWAINSWGEGWSVKGTFGFSWNDLDRLIHENGEAATIIV